MTIETFHQPSPLTAEQLDAEFAARVIEDTEGYTMMQYPDARPVFSQYRGNQTWLEVAIEANPDVRVARFKESTSLYAAYAPEAPEQAPRRKVGFMRRMLGRQAANS